MHFDRTDEQQAIFDMALSFAQERIAPHAAEWEEAGTIPRDFLRHLGALGFGGIYVSEKGDGSELGGWMLPLSSKPFRKDSRRVRHSSPTPPRADRWIMRFATNIASCPAACSTAISRKASGPW